MGTYVYEAFTPKGESLGAKHNLKDWNKIENIRIVRVPNDEDKWHICPYAAEILADCRTLCDCNEEQTNNCSMEI